MSESTRAASVEEVLGIADALERGAVARYVKLADTMRQVGHDDLAATFQSLAAEEQLHVDGVQRLAQKIPSKPSAAGLRRWVLPETFGVEEAGPAALLTPYKALSIAVRAEERAFSFWTYVASTAEDERVRIQAEEMARQELVHAAKLRHARRRAYHAEYPYGRRSPAIPSHHDASAVKSALVRLEGGARAALLEIAGWLERVQDVESARMLRDSVAALTSAQLAPERIRHADVDHRILWAARAGSAGLLFEAVGVLERLAESGLEMLNAGPDDVAADEIQDWIDRIIKVVARLNARLYALEPRLAEIAAEPGTGSSPLVR